MLVPKDLPLVARQRIISDVCSIGSGDKTFAQAGAKK
jgi:hypothetical protein